MAWGILFDDAFELEFRAYTQAVQDELLATAGMLEELGPTLGRPWVDTLKGSHYPNMKELRFGAAGGVWRVAFAFDPERKAVLLVGGNKGGQGQAKFYRTLIKKADARYGRHLAGLKKGV